MMTENKESSAIVKDENAREEQIKNLMQGKTLQVYWFLLTKTSSGIREIQRGLKFSSPSVVSYHLKRLQKVNLVQQLPDTDKYIVIEQVQVGILSFYYKLGRMLVPRYLFYTGFFGGIIVILVVNIFIQNNITPIDLVALLSCVIAIIIFSYESYRVSALKPV